MKKKIFLMCIIGLLSITSAYAKCDGGTEITNTAGTTFCRSDVGLSNWWSAYAWCRANGRTLATMYEMCPSWDGNTGGGKCPELSGKGGGSAWSATAYGEHYTFIVDLSNGHVSNIYGRHGSGSTFPVICR